ncbi:MAG: signal peptide peptidase SppA [Alphaproteobacteria bacterium]|nr:signal peptide peptidase SppA [Alphaproteobacteria bacterium]
MAFDADAVLDRRRLKRRLRRWRVAAVVALVALVGVAASEFGALPERPYVARLDLEGVILDERRLEEKLAELAEDRAVRALILRVNSPGGTTTGAEMVYRGLRRIAERRPTVAVMGTVAASGGYLAALAADHLLARETTITGSIGVAMETVEVTRLLDKLGVTPLSFKSSPLKAQPNPLEPLAPGAREATQALVDDTYEWFLDLLIERRGLEREAARKLADGRVYTGRQAVANKLIDGLGGESEARAWLASREVPVGLPVRDVKLRGRAESWLEDMLGRAQKVLLPERHSLDGLTSLWHPSR